MRVLVVGGTGLVGADAALLLRDQRHDVTIMARKPSDSPLIAALPFLQGDYVNDDPAKFPLSEFDALVFAAAADIRYLPMDGSIAPEDFYSKVNDVAVPAFFEAARAAGMSKAIYIGTFYPQVAPHRIGECPYVTSRHNTDVAVRALATGGFNVCSLSLPFVLGHIPGLVVPHIDAMASYARGEIEGMPVFAPKGGVNHISSRSVAQAVSGALARGESGKAYLLADQNYSWKEYLERWFTAAGNPQELSVLEDDHPLLPNVIMFAGAGVTVAVEPDKNEVALLDYERNQIDGLIQEIAQS